MKKPQFSLFDAPVETVKPPFPDAMDDLNPMGTNQRDERDVHLLALDLASRTGWATCDKSGVKLFSTPEKPERKNTMGESVNDKRVEKFWDWLAMMRVSWKIQTIVYEKPIIFRAEKRRPNFLGVELVGILKLFCRINNLSLTGYQNAHIKKFATGKGNAKKEKMIRTCVTRYGITPDDDNEADALHLYHLAIQDLKL